MLSRMIFVTRGSYPELGKCINFHLPRYMHQQISTNKYVARAQLKERRYRRYDVQKDEQKPSGTVVPHEFGHVFPDFLPEPDFERRHPIKEKLERLDMLKRRMNLDIPEFYVGSILAVTCSDPYAPKRMNRFVGICIDREWRGLWHAFQLRNVIDGIAVEVPYDMYNPLIQSIQVLRLEKRPDVRLHYLRDALLEYSTFPFDMQPETLPPGSPIPVNLTKVKLKDRRWTAEWQYQDLYGIEDGAFDQLEDIYKQKYYKFKFEPWAKYDLVKTYRLEAPIDDQQKFYDQALEFEEENQSQVKRSGRRINTVGGYFKNQPTNVKAMGGSKPDTKAIKNTKPAS